MNAPANKPTTDELLKQIADLQAKLGHTEKERDDATKMAAAMAEASAFTGGGTAEEQPTGNTVKMKRCVNPAERDEKKLKWVDVEVPTFMYHISLPAGAGVSLMTNGMEYFHDQTYEVDQYTLADLKSRVARTWDHERAIHSENENAYRKPSHTHLKSRAAMQAGY